MFKRKVSNLNVQPKKEQNENVDVPRNASLIKNSFL